MLFYILYFKIKLIYYRLDKQIKQKQKKLFYYYYIIIYHRIL
jgi:hypothetical protein